MKSSAKEMLDRALEMPENAAPPLQNSCSPVLMPSPTKMSRSPGSRKCNTGYRNSIAVMSNACRGKR